MGIKNIIMISIDALRFDCVGYQKDKRFLERYGVKEILHTPTLDSIAEKGLCFSQAVSTSTYTTNAHASVMTGLYPPRHGVRSFYKNKLAGGVKTVAELLKPYGFNTVLLSDIPELFVPVGLGAGFDKVLPDCYETSSNKDNELFEHLKRLNGGKVFLMAHFFDVHEPYCFSETPPNEGYNNEYNDLMSCFFKTLDIAPPSDPNDPYVAFRELKINLQKKGLDSTKVLIESYVRGVNKFDSGRFKAFMENLGALGLLDDSLLIIFADHGESKNHNGFGHNGPPHEGMIRVPLILQSNRIKPGVNDIQASHVDMVPTVLEMLDSNYRTKIKLDYEFDGSSLLTESTNDREAYGEVWTQDKVPDSRIIHKKFDRLRGLKIDARLGWRMLRTPERKFILSGMPETLNLSNIIKFDGEEFVRELYLHVLGRFPDPEGLDNSLRFLDRGGAKEELFQNVLNSKEKRQNPTFAMYNPKQDPFDENPINPFSDPSNAHLFIPTLCRIMSISSSAAKSTDVFSQHSHEEQKEEAEQEIAFTDADEEEQVMGRLRDLGYME